MPGGPDHNFGSYPLDISYNYGGLLLRSVLLVGFCGVLLLGLEVEQYSEWLVSQSWGLLKNFFIEYSPFSN